jgi:hypothetical protein
MRGLEVQALPGRVGGQSNLGFRVGRQLRGDLAALSAAHTAVDRLDGLMPAEQRADPAREGYSSVSRCSVKTMSLRCSSPAPDVARVLSSRIVRSSDHLRSVSDARARAATSMSARRSSNSASSSSTVCAAVAASTSSSSMCSSSSAEHSSSSNSSSLRRRPQRLARRSRRPRGPPPCDARHDRPCAAASDRSPPGSRRAAAAGR